MNMFILWMATNAEATTMVPLSIDQMVDLSSTVVRGKVTNVWTEPDAKTHTVWTYAQVEVDKVFKGNMGTDILVVEQPGGTWGTTDTLVESVARFSVGEEGYFFPVCRRWRTRRCTLLRATPRMRTTSSNNCG